MQAADGYLSAFPQTEFAQTEQLLSRHPAVPYYVMHKLLAGLLAHHELWNATTALGVATRLGVGVGVGVGVGLGLGVEVEVG